MAETEAKLPYLIMDADEHSSLGVPDMYEEYIDPEFRDKAVRYVEQPDGTRVRMFAGRPARLAPKEGESFQVTFSDEQLKELGVSSMGLGADGLIPGSTLNRLNPLRTITDEKERKEFIEKYRYMTGQLASVETRVDIMDMQGVEACVNYLNFGDESDFEHDIVALYANQHAANRYYAETWSFNYKNRIFTPPFISTCDAALAMKELDFCMAQGAPIIQISTGPSVHRSPFRPEMDTFWAKVNEAKIRVCTHLSGATFYGRQGQEWDEDEVLLSNMNAFQWMMYYGDRPAYETVAAAILQGWLAKFPNIKLLLSEQGTVWVPYIVRKMDHAFLLGRRASFDRKLEMRPSEYFRQRVFVAPYPEENVDRLADAVGIDPITFGSDFPHGEGLPDPMLYMAQLKNFDDTQIKQIMRGNLARYLDLPA
jgi:predicted TIM-barrel fold metal-dependent hydrolase